MSGDVNDRRDLGAFIPADLDDYGLDPVEFRVYSRIVRRAGADGHYESTSAVAKAIGVGERKVREALGLLRAAGLVVCEKRPGTSDLYRLTPASSWLPSDQLPTLRATVRRPNRTRDEADSDPDTPVPTTARSQGPRSDGPGGHHDRGPDDRTPRSPRPDTAVPRTDEGSPLKGIPQGEGSPTARPVAASCDLVEVESAGGEYVVTVDLADPEASFEALWDRYPRHPKTGNKGGGGDKRLAKRRWARLPRQAQADALRRVGWYAADCVAADRQPQHLEVWINRRRWESFEEPPAAPGDGLDDFAAAVAEVTGTGLATLTPSERGELVTAAQALEFAGADERQLRDVQRRWRKEWPQIPITRAGLLRHWSRFAAQQRAGGGAVSVCNRCRQPKDAEQHDRLCAEIASMIHDEVPA